MKTLVAVPAVVLSLYANQTMAGGFSGGHIEIVGPEIRNPVANHDEFGNPEKEIVRTLCALPTGGHSIYIPHLATDLINHYGELKLNEYGDGTAVLEGLVYSRSNPNIELDVYVQFSDLKGTVDLDGLHAYHHTAGELVGIGSDSRHFSVGLDRKGDAFAVGYGASKKSDHYGAAAWFMTYGSHEVHGDINVNLVSCQDRNYPPKKAKKITFEIGAANGSACSLGDGVSLGSGTEKHKIDLEIPMINLETDRFARGFCQASVVVNKPAGVQFAVKQYDAWYEVNLNQNAKARITGSAYFQGDANTQTFETELEGRLKKKADIHQTAEDLIFSNCEESDTINLKAAANVRSGWGALTLKPLQRFQLVWKKCH